MRNLRSLDAHRVNTDNIAHFGHWSGDETCGAFKLPSPTDGQSLRVIASSGEGWDHVSVSRASRCPNWIEMEFIKRKFFEDNETAMQLHVPLTDHIDQHPFCLHIWKPQFVAIPRPPPGLVGTK